MKIKKEHKEHYFSPSKDGDDALSIVCTPEFRKAVIFSFQDSAEKNPDGILLFGISGNFVSKNLLQKGR